MLMKHCLNGHEPRSRTNNVQSTVASIGRENLETADLTITKLVFDEI